MKIKLFFFTEREKLLTSKEDMTLKEIEEWIELSYKRKVRVTILIFLLMEIFFHSACILPSEIFLKEDKAPFIFLESACFILTIGVLFFYSCFFRGKPFWEIRKYQLKNIARYKLECATMTDLEKEILSRIKKDPLFGEIFPEALVLEKIECEEEKGYFSRA